MKLWVDDIRNAPDQSWTVARTVLSAIRALARFEFDEISLDHDISHQVSIGTKLERPFPCEETFESVAHFIAAKYWYDRPLAGSVHVARLNKIPKVVIHTSNPLGAETMKVILEAVGIPTERRPFGAANRLEMEV